MDTEGLVSVRFGMSQPRVLFLDFDGVLHPGPLVQTKLTQFCWLPTLIRLLAPFDDVRVVVHSTRRHMYDVSELKGLLGQLGARVIGATPPEGRWESIESWLLANEPVRSFRILDDDLGEFSASAPKKLIVCNPEDGISCPDVQSHLRRWL